MFTGLIREVGNVRGLRDSAEGKTVVVESPKIISDVQLGDSIAINGVCLTVSSLRDELLLFDAVWTTLEKTNLGELKEDSRVNLEPALRPMDRLGGHIVQGHVEGTATLLALKSKGENWDLDFALSPDLAKRVIAEGSIALNGISLTIAKVLRDTSQGMEFRVTIIPHTWKETNLNALSVGEKINVETDMMAKYLEKWSSSYRGI